MISSHTKILFIATLALAIESALAKAQDNQPLADAKVSNRDSSVQNSPPIVPVHVTVHDFVGCPASHDNKEGNNSNGGDQVYRVDVVDKPSHFWLPFSLNTLAAFVGIVTSIAVFAQLKALIVSQRAWVIVTPDAFDPQKEVYGGSPVPSLRQMPFSLKNVGPTPARLTCVSLRYVLLDSLNDLPKVPTYAESLDRRSLFLVPQDSTNELVKLEDDRGFQNQELINRLGSQDLVLYAYGYVRYLDSFKRKRETRFGFHFAYVALPVTARRAPRRAGPSAYNKAT